MSNYRDPYDRQDPFDSYIPFYTPQNEIPVKRGLCSKQIISIIAAVLAVCLCITAVFLFTGNKHFVALPSGKTNFISSRAKSQSYSPAQTVSATTGHVIALKNDGSVYSAGSYMATGDGGYLGNCETNGWNDVVEVFTGTWFTGALKSDGSLLLSGSYVPEGLENWSDIISVSSFGTHMDCTVAGLKKDGRVVVDDSNDDHSTDSWQDIVSVRAGGFGAVYGLTKDGRLLSNSRGCDVSGLSNVAAVFADPAAVAALKTDGTVELILTDFGASHAPYSPADVRSWTDIVDIAIDTYSIIGLKKDGSLLCAGTPVDENIRNWKNIERIYSCVDDNDRGLLAISKHGTMLTAGYLCGGYDRDTGISYGLDFADASNEVAQWSDIRIR